MAAPNAGSGFIWGPGVTVVISLGSVPTTYSGGIVWTTGAVSQPVDIKQMMFLSFQTELTTGVASLTVDIQVTNVPDSRSGYKNNSGTGYGVSIPSYRDDSFASNDWITVATNVMATTPASRMDVLGFTPHSAARVRLTSAGVTTLAYVYVKTQGWGS